MAARSLYASGRSVFGPSFSLASSGSHDDVHPGRVRSFLMPRVAEMMDQMREECKADIRNQHEQLCETLNLLNNVNEKIEETQKVANELEWQEEMISKTEEEVQALEAQLYDLFEAEEQATWSTLLKEKQSQQASTGKPTSTELGSKETSQPTNSLSFDNDTDADDDVDVDKENTNGTTHISTSLTTTGDDINVNINVDDNMDTRHEEIDERTQLLDRINELQQMRKTQLKQLAQLQSNNTSSHRIEDYKQLISRCCDISVDEVDDMLDTLLENIEADEEYLTSMDHQSQQPQPQPQSQSQQRLTPPITK
jgi:predicted nuclease with TOPRIM domain